MNNNLKVTVLGYPVLSAFFLVYDTLTNEREAPQSYRKFYEHFRENNMEKIELYE